MDVQNIKLGTAELSYKGLELGHSIGDVNAKYTPEYHTLKVNRYGNTRVNEFLIGEDMEITIPLAETTLELLKTITPVSQMVTDDVTGAKKLIFGSSPGKELLSQAGLLSLHPIWAGTGVKDYDVTIYKACVRSAVELGYKVEGELVYNTTFVAFIDESRPEGDRLFCIGDPEVEADLTAPIVSSSVPANASTAIAVGSTIQFTMSKGIDLSTVVKDNVMLLTAAGVPVSGTVSYTAATKKIIFTPDANLTALTDYLAILTTGVKSINGIPLAASHVVKFKTA